MVLRFLIRYLANEHLVQRLADSWIMRRVARKLVETYLKSRKAIEEDATLRRGFEKISEEFKKRKGP